MESFKAYKVNSDVSKMFHYTGWSKIIFAPDDYNRESYK
jgi:hypothetical protein